MKVLLGEVSVSLDDEGLAVQNKTGNLLELSKDIEGSDPTDRIASVTGKHVVADGEVQGRFYFKENMGMTLDYGFGLYDKSIEILLTTEPGYVVAALFWSTQTGNFLLMPSALSNGKGWKAVFTVHRAEPREMNVQDVTDVAFTEGMTKVEKVDFLLTQVSHLINEIDGPSFTQEEAECLATHRHYKGGLYRRLGRIRNADDGLFRTLYLHLYPHDVSLWHRDTEEFDDFLNTGEKRFAPIEDQLPFILNDDGESTEVNVVLRRIADEPISGIRFTMQDAMQLVPELNERARKGLMLGEYGHSRSVEITDFSVCCQFTHFAITEVTTKQQKKAKVLTGMVQPSGPMALDFMDQLRASSLVGFAMRCTGEQVQDADESYMVPKRIITFDFAPKKK